MVTGLILFPNTLSTEALRAEAEPIAIELHLPAYAEADYVRLKQQHFVLITVLNLVAVAPFQLQWSLFVRLLVEYDLYLTDAALTFVLLEFVPFVQIPDKLCSLASWIAKRSHPAGAQILERLEQVRQEEQETIEQRGTTRRSRMTLNTSVITTSGLGDDTRW